MRFYIVETLFPGADIFCCLVPTLMFSIVFTCILAYIVLLHSHYKITVKV